MAVVLKRLDYSETSQVIAVFTREHGQERLIAKGIKRGTRSRVAVGVDLLELGHLVYSSNPNKTEALGILTEWRQVESFPHLRGDLARLYAAQYAAEVTAQLTEVHDAHAALFDGLIALLRRLANHDPLAALVEFLLVLLREVGLRPQWSLCTNCGREVRGDPTIYFSSRQGGVICRDCEPAMIEKRRIEGPTLQRICAMEASESGDGGRSEPIASADAARAFDLLDYHLREIMSRPAKLSGPFRAAVGMAPQ